MFINTRKEYLTRLHRYGVVDKDIRFGTNLVDSSTRGTYRPEQPARWIALNGTNQYWKTDSDAGDWSAVDWTVEIICNPDALGASTILAQQDGTGTGRSWILVDSTDISSNLGGSTIVLSSDPLVVGEIAHLLLTHNSSTNQLTLWVNGVEKNTVSLTVEAATGPFVFGAAKTESGGFFDGNIYHAALHDSVLSDSQIATQYSLITSPHEIPANYAWPTHLWSCQDNSSTVLKDSGTASTKLDATLINSPTIGEAAAKDDGHFSLPNLVGWTKAGLGVVIPRDEADTDKHVTTKVLTFNGTNQRIRYTDLDFSDGNYKQLPGVRARYRIIVEGGGSNGIVMGQGGFAAASNAGGWYMQKNQFALKLDDGSVLLWNHGQTMNPGTWYDIVWDVTMPPHNTPNASLASAFQLHSVTVNGVDVTGAATTGGSSSGDFLYGGGSFLYDFGVGARDIDSSSADSPYWDSGLQLVSIQRVSDDEWYVQSPFIHGDGNTVDNFATGDSHLITNYSSSMWNNDGIALDLDYTGRVPRDFQLSQSPCWTSGASQQYVLTSLDPIQGNGAEFSVSFGYKTTIFTTQCIASQRDSQFGASREQWMVLMSGSFRVIIYESGDTTGNYKDYSATPNAGGSFADGVERNLSFTFANGTLRLFENGVECQNVTKFSDDAMATIYERGAGNNEPLAIFHRTANGTPETWPSVGTSVWDLRIGTSDTSDANLLVHVPLSEGAGDEVIERVSKTNLTIVNASNNWNVSQNLYHHAVLYGCTLYTHASSDPIELPQNTDGTYNTTSQTGYAKQADIAAGGLNSKYTQLGRIELGSPDLQNYNVPGDTASPDNRMVGVDGDDLDLVVRRNETYSKSYFTLKK